MLMIWLQQVHAAENAEDARLMLLWPNAGPGAGPGSGPTRGPGATAGRRAGSGATAAAARGAGTDTTAGTTGGEDGTTTGAEGGTMEAAAMGEVGAWWGVGSGRQAAQGWCCRAGALADTGACQVGPAGLQCCGMSCAACSLCLGWQHVRLRVLSACAVADAVCLCAAAGSRGGGGGGGPGVSHSQPWRSGDWECRGCGVHNFASRCAEGRLAQCGSLLLGSLPAQAQDCMARVVCAPALSCLLACWGPQSAAGRS